MRKNLCLAWLTLAVVAGVPARPASAQDSATHGVPTLAVNSLAAAPAPTVTAVFEDVALDAALAEISRQTGIPVMYGEDVFRAVDRVSARLRQVEFADALDRVLRPTSFVAVPAPAGNGVIVKRRPAPQQRPAAPDTVLGRVVEAGSGTPIVGAEVVVGERRVALTDRNGRFVLALPAGSYEVKVVMLGYSPQAQTVVVPSPTPRAVLFQLQLKPFTLNEIVATGVTDPIQGAKLPFTVGRISGDEVNAVSPSGSVLSSLQGKVAGVSIVRTTGHPGEEPDILLRSPTSIQDSNAPMIVVDGVILASSYTNSSVDITALDIESIEVVKGAAAASLYGSRAASGVIQIRTRRGNGLPEGTTRITARSEFGTSQAPTDLPLARHHYFVTNEQGEFLDATGQVTTDPARRVIDADRIMDNAYGVRLYDNVATFFRPGRYMSNSVTLSQNSEATNFSLSIVDRHEQGSLEANDGYRNRSFRLNLDHRLADDFALSASAYHSRGYREMVSGTPYFTLLSYSPEVDLGKKDADGNYLQQPDPMVAVENPIWYQTSRDNEQSRLRTLANAQARYTPLPWLTLTGVVSYDRTDLSTELYTPKGTPLSLTGGNVSTGELRKTHNGVDALNGQINANLMHTFGDLTARLNLTALQEREKNDFMMARGIDFYVPEVPSLDAAGTRYVSSSLTEIRSTGYLAQTGLDYRGRYIGDLLVRRDGSSLFGPDERWQTYYRGAFAYRISEEPWFRIPGIDDLKLRYARGTAGGRPAYGDRFETWTVLSDGSVYRDALGNRNLKPSLTTEQEFGVDLMFLDRFALQLSYVDKVTEDQLISVPTRAVTGYYSQVRNAGTMEGNTIEATLEAWLIETPDFSWHTSLVADRSRSRITEWGRSCYVTGLVKYCGGQSMSDIWGQRFVRSAEQLPAAVAAFADQFQLNDDGFLVPVGAGNSYKDGLASNLWGTTVNIGGTNYAWGLPIVERDSAGLAVVEKIGSSAPDLSLGWFNSFTWKGFNVVTHMHAQIGGEVYNNTRQRLYYAKRHGDLDQSGKPDELKKPEPYYYALYNLNAYVDEFLEDGSFLKLREISVSYGLNRADLARLGLGGLGVERISLGLAGRNLLTLSKYTGFDPEVGTILHRLDSFSYPNTRTFTSSVEITF